MHTRLPKASTAPKIGREWFFFLATWLFLPPRRSTKSLTIIAPTFWQFQEQKKIIWDRVLQYYKAHLEWKEISSFSVMKGSLAKIATTWFLSWCTDLQKVQNFKGTKSAYTRNDLVPWCQWTYVFTLDIGQERGKFVDVLPGEKNAVLPWFTPKTNLTTLNATVGENDPSRTCHITELRLQRCASVRWVGVEEQHSSSNLQRQSTIVEQVQKFCPNHTFRNCILYGFALVLLQYMQKFS